MSDGKGGQLAAVAENTNGLVSKGRNVYGKE